MAEQMLVSKPIHLGGFREWRKPFIAALAASGNVTAAAKSVGTTRTTVHRYRASNAAFAREWDDAINQWIDTVQFEGYKRVKQGSDAMIQFFLKHWAPERYGDKVVHEHRLTPAKRREIEQIARDAGLNPEEVLAEAENILRALVRK